MWNSSDPRFYIDKFAEIIIVDVRLNNLIISLGQVYTDYGSWSIYTNFENYKCIAVDVYAII